jgi:beta-mannosidase
MRMTRRINLNGVWKLRWSDDQRGGPVDRLFQADADMSRALNAAVPGEVHLDLMKAGLIAEPAVGLNTLSARWAEECHWRYRRTFEGPALKPDERAHLVFEGLDLRAVIYLNGREVGRHANAFHPCRIDVTGTLKRGENVLVVDIESGVNHVADKPLEGYGVREPTKRHWLRKTQSSFGWDWSPRLLNVGIHGNVSLEIASGVRFDRLVALAELTPDLKRGTVTVRVFAEGLDDRKRKGVLTAQIAEARRKANATVKIGPGLQALEVKVGLDKPDLWWPVNHGAQTRYTVKATLTVEGRVVGSDTRRVGFRHVRINQGPHPTGGRYFVLEVNGKPIFAKGGNLVPADLIFARIDRPRYQTLTDRALEASFNLLRVWGGGLYESDDFYDICDEKGIMVWQEFIFACAKYPAHDEQFLADVTREATHQVRRLSHHPSLVVWCGNNEIEEGYYNWRYDRGVSLPDYALYHLVLARIVKQEDGTRYYQPSSPYSPDQQPPNQPDIGDQHPWSIGFENTDFRGYRKMICRFPNEGGILGPTALPTVRACLPPGHERPGSFAWEQHDNSVSYWPISFMCPDRMLEQWLGKSLASMSLEDYVYYGGVLQGEGLAEYIGNFRRRMFDCASAVFWMYNDCWPAVRSWTIVDYYLRRTPSFHPVRRAFQPVSVVIACEDGRVRIFGVNEGRKWRGRVRFGLFALTGGLPVDVTRTVVLKANASTPIGEFDQARWTRLGEKTHGAFAILSRNGAEVARSRMFLPLFKEMAWPRATLNVRREGGRAVFESETFAWRVCLDLDGETVLPDNFFDVLPGIPTVLKWPSTLGEPRVIRVGNLV